MSLIYPIPSLLYHYCSMDAFYGIITSKSLWLMDVYSNNDHL